MMSVLERARAASPVIAGFMGVTCLPANDCAGRETLHLDVFIGAADSWDVTSTLIYGKSEAILVDCQFRISQAKKLADQVAARGRRLKAIIVTHPIRLFVQGEGSRRHNLGQPTGGRTAAVAVSDRALRPLSGLRRMDQMYARSLHIYKDDLTARLGGVFPRLPR